MDEAVKDGVITQEQEQAILDKWQEIQKRRRQEKEELINWLREQGIDIDKLSNYFSLKYRQRFKGMRIHSWF